VSDVIVRCSHCNGVMLKKVSPKCYEASLYYATLGSTRPLQEAVDGAVRLPSGKIIEIREAPGFCSQRCFEEIVRTTPPGGWRPIVAARDESDWSFFRSWRYKVLWDHRSEVAHEPPLAPSVLTYTLRHPEAP